MTQQEKAAFWTANLLMALPGLVLLVVLGYVAWTLKLFEKPWEDAGEPGFVWMMAGLLLLVALMPGTVLFKLVGRKVRTGSFWRRVRSLKDFARGPNARGLSRDEFLLWPFVSRKGLSSPSAPGTMPMASH
jgi:hypothetical protein